MLLALCLCGAAAAPGTTTTAAELVQVADGVFVRVGETADATAANADGIANTGFIIGGNAVAVIDPGGSLPDGLRLRAALRARTALPVRYVIFTHVHPDHIFGASAFIADHPLFVGHANLPPVMAARYAYDLQRLASQLGAAAAGAPVIPSRLVSTTDSLDLGGRILTVLASPPAHSTTDLVVLDGATGTLWAGDLLFVGRIPSLDGNLLGWLQELAALTSLPARRAVPGHGPASVAWPAGAADETRYLRLLRDDVRAALAHGVDIDAAVNIAGQGERAKWSLFDAYNGRNVTVAYKQLQWEDTK